MIFCAAMLMGIVHPVLAGEGDKVKVVANDTTSSNVLFNVRASEKDQLTVDVTGISVDLASVSLIDRKGETQFFTFLSSSEEHVTINLSNIEPGMYYVKLNMDSEIRMKLVVIEKQ